MSYPYFKNWKECIRPETVAYIDLDQVVYVCAASNESRTIKATHKISGREKEFNTRTEFWGNKKTAIGGFLGDINTDREIKNLQPFTKDDFDVIDIQKANKIEFCLSNIKHKINISMEHLGLTNYIGVVGGKSNFRLDLPAPNQYKSNRADTLRPLQLQEAREYVIKHHNTQVIDLMEADDFLAMKGYESYLHFKKHGWFSNIIMSYDKDQLSVPTFMFNTYSENGEFKHPIPVFVDDGCGELFLEKGKVKGFGFKFMCHQMLIGDSSDCITPYQPFKIRFGETASYKLIQPCETKQECLEIVINKYKEWFPSGVEFINWDGTNIKMTAGQWMDNIYKMVHMKLEKNDKSSLAKLIKELNIKL